VRFFVTPEPPSKQAVRRGPADGVEGMSLYEEPSAAPRAEVVRAAEVEASAARALDRLVAPGAAEVPPLVDAEVAPAGVEGPPAGPAAAVTLDLPTRVEVRADVPAGGGFLVLRDSYSPHWRAEVDGLETPLLRADGLFRAVRLAPGPHVVRLVFRPTPVYAGATVSALTALLLLALVLRRS
jgi:hypothetical protein